MINIKKISKVVLVAGALVFASFYTFDAKTQTIEEDQAKINAAQQDRNRKERKADQAATASSSKSTEQYEASSKEMFLKGAEASLQEYSKNAYKSGNEYTNAQSNYQTQNRRRQDNIKSVTATEDQKVATAQQQYDECMKRNGSCASYLVTLNQAKDNRDAAIKKATEGDEQYQEALKAKQNADNKLNEYQQKANEAEAARQQAKEKGVTAANQAIQANQDKIAVAEKEKAKAQQKLDDATKEVEKKCKDPNSNACKKAMQKMDEASIEVGAANKTISEANSAIAQAQTQKMSLTIDDDMADFEAELDAQFQQNLEAQNAAAKKQQADRQKIQDAEEANTKYDAAVNDYKQAAEDLAKLQRDCSTKKETNCKEKIKTAEKKLAEAKNTADAAYKTKQAAEKTAATVEGGDAAKYKHENAIAKEKAAREAYEKDFKKYDDECKAGNKDSCAKANQLKSDFDAAKKELSQASQNLSKIERTTAEQNLAAAKDKVATLEANLKEAKAACEHSSTLTSKQGKADAEKYCAMQAQLEQQLAVAKEDLMQAELEYDQALAWQDGLDALDGGAEHEGMEYKAFSTATGEIFGGTYSGSIDYSNTGDVFTTLTRRAARILVGLKPIVYVFAGFGLIAFAFMAIFNKISWKWFANIAIGLFLVANMGRLIEYMVYTVDNRDLAATEKPSEFGDHLHGAFADTEYAWVDEMTPYMPPEIVETPDTSVQPPADDEKETEIRGFCEAEQKGGGLFGGGGFASCVKDLISAGKKAVDTAKKVQDTVDTVKNTVDSVKYAADNIGAAIDKIGEGNLEDSFNALSQIGQNVNYIVGSTGGMMNNVMSNTMDIANNVQDISKSRDEQAKLQARRDRGEATGGFTAALMGQKVTRDEDGNVTGVERRWAGNLEYDENGNVIVKSSGFDQYGNAVEGDIASNKKNMQNTGQLGFMDITNDVVQKSGQLNQKFNEASQTAGALTGAVANFSAFGSKSINEGRQERQAEERAAKVAQKNAERAVAEQERLENLSSASGAGIQQSYEDRSSVSDAKEAADEYNKAKSQATTAENNAKRAENTAKSAQQKADELAAKAAKTGLEADKIAAEAAQKEADRAKRKAEEARAEAEDLKSKVSEAESKANAAAVKATEDVRDQAKSDMDTISKDVEAAKKALEAAQAEGDETKIKQAKEELSRQQDRYDAAEQVYYQAAAKHASLTEDKEARQQAEQRLEDEKTAAEIIKEYEQKSNPVNVATEAKNELRQAETEAAQAQGDARNKEAAAQKAQQAAKEAQEKADRTGLASDREAAELAKVKAEQAATASAEAAKKAATAEAAIAPLKDKVHEALVNQADYLEKKSQADVEKYAESVKQAEEALSNTEDELAAAEVAAAEARRKAEQTRDPSDIVAAQKAADEVKQKEKALTQAQKKLETESKNYNNAYVGQYEARAEKADLTEDAQAKQEAYAKEVEEQRQEERKQEADRLRAEYAQSTSPVAVAQAAENKLAAAQKEVRQAEILASSKEQSAKEATVAAQEAAKLADKTGDPADQRRANELQRRANLATQEAATAQAALEQTQKPLKELEENARQANIKEAVYYQEVYKTTLEEAEKTLPQYRTSVDNAQKAMDKAYAEVQKKIAAAQANPNDDNIVIAAKRAYDEYILQQQTLQKAQKQLEEEIRHRNDAERQYNEAYARQLKLEGK